MRTSTLEFIGEKSPLPGSEESQTPYIWISPRQKLHWRQGEIWSLSAPTASYFHLHQQRSLQLNSPVLNISDRIALKSQHGSKPTPEILAPNHIPFFTLKCPSSHCQIPSPSVFPLIQSNESHGNEAQQSTYIDHPKWHTHLTFQIKKINRATTGPPQNQSYPTKNHFRNYLTDNRSLWRFTQIQ